MFISKNKNFGLNILTERKTTTNKGSYESGDFVETHDDIYTDAATIYQSILEYSVEFGIAEYFTSEDMTRHLVLSKPTKCKFYENLYSGNKAKTNDVYKIRENIEDIESALGMLTYLELVSFRDNKYQFTKLGRLIGLLFLYKKGKITNSNDFSNHVVDFYDTMNHSSAKWFSIFLRKCGNSKVFFDEMDHLLSLLDDAPADKDLSIMQIKNVNPRLNKESWKVMDDSFSEFEDNNLLKCNILFYNLKLILEELHEGKSRKFKDYEEIRFKARQDQFSITLEGYCKNCNMYTPITSDTTHYFRSYANSDHDNKNNHMNIKCPNLQCKNGYLNFEFVTDEKTVKENPNTKVKRGEKFHVNLIGNRIDYLGTIFKRDENGDFNYKSKRYQTILKLLYDNPDKFFTARELFKEIKKIDSSLFKDNKKEETDDVSAEDYHHQFVSYLNLLDFANMVYFREVQGYKTPGLVKEYQLTPVGRYIALLAKYNLGDTTNQTYNEIYQTWKSLLDNPPISSLNRFCKKYFYECKESGLFKEFVENHIKYFLSNLEMHNDINLFTQVVLLRFDDRVENNKSKNETLKNLWMYSLTPLDAENQKLFLYHIKTHLNRLIEKKVHDFYKYEISRYEHRENYEKITIEGVCKNCSNEYIYLPVPITEYIGYLFLSKSKDRQLKWSGSDIKCQSCKSNDFDFIRV